jgi:integrase
MSSYFTKGKGWRYDFTLNGIRYTKTWFKTKTEAKTAESQRREELAKPEQATVTPTDMAFLELVNRRLDHVKAYNSPSHYDTYIYAAKGWVNRWGNLSCGQINPEMVQEFLIERSKVSAYTANRELRYLRATFNYGRKAKWIMTDPTEGVPFFPVEKRVRFIPSATDVIKVLSAADKETREYLTAIADTMARVSEINRLKWDDVSLDQGYLVLYTRKKKGGHLTPRKVPLTKRLADILKNRFKAKKKSNPYVFYSCYEDWKTKKRIVAPFKHYRKTILRTLCKKAGVRRFTFHALRHAGASIMDNHNVPIGSIQRILGHENRSTTEIYLHTLRDAEREAIAIYERAIEKSHTDSHTEGNLASR